MKRASQLLHKRLCSGAAALTHLAGGASAEALEVCLVGLTSAANLKEGATRPESLLRCPRRGRNYGVVAAAIRPLHTICFAPNRQCRLPGRAAPRPEEGTQRLNH